MTCASWNDDPPGSEPVIAANIAGLLPDVARDSLVRTPPSVALALEWHRRVYAGVRVPEAEYVGNIRDTDPRFPCLIGYEVVVGGLFGVGSRDVPNALASFEGSLTTAVAGLDRAILPGVPPRSAAELRGFTQLCANVHGEWIRIHPLANGNGRIARIWVNWLAYRYTLPPFLRIKPRPGSVFFAGAAAASMKGDHGPMETFLAAELKIVLARASGAPGP